MIELKTIGVKVYSPPTNLNFLKRLFILQKYIKEFKPDALLGVVWGFWGLIDFLLAKYNNLPYFNYLRGNIKENGQKCLMFQSSLVGNLFMYLSFMIPYFALKNSTAIFTVSNHLTNEIRNQLNMQEKDIITIYPSVDLKRFHPNHDPYFFKNLLGLEEDVRVIITVMNFEFKPKVSGLLYFLESIGEVLKEYKNLRYIIAGEGSLKYLIERKVEKMELKNSILLPGFVREIEKAYASSEFLIHTSFLEAAGLIILEAGASGKPVIVNRCGGMPELVSEGDTGFIVGKTDCKELKEKIILLLEDDELRYKMGSNARKRVEKLHNREKIGNIISKNIRKYIHNV